MNIPIAVYSEACMTPGMDLVALYGCLCDRTRLRIVHLLLEGPLCVHHVQAALEEPQVKVSKHLGYLRRAGMVSAERCANMMVYRLTPKPSKALRAHLACLQECVREDASFRADRARLRKLRRSFGSDTPECVRDPAAGCA